jgi:hypothetical protein
VADFPPRIIPADDEEVSAESELAAAVAGALEDPLLTPEITETPTPLGRSWAFDFEAGRFHRAGGSSPTEVRGETTLAQWILASLHTAAGAHASLPVGFGMEDPNDVIGYADPEEALADWEERVREALLMHDRIAAVDSIELEWNASEGIIYLRRMDVILDEAEAVRLLDVPVQPEV